MTTLAPRDDAFVDVKCRRCQQQNEVSLRVRSVGGVDLIYRKSDSTMHDTYENAAEAETDRAQQKMLLSALAAWDRALHHDECGTWCISGTRGTVHTWDDGKSWVLFVACRSVRHWTAAKTRLSFCTVMQDGDDEGSCGCSSLPRQRRPA